MIYTPPLCGATRDGEAGRIMTELNKRLSGWDAMHACFCGRWSKSPKRDRMTYERSGEGKWARVFADVEHVDACEVCGYDLTQEPLDNLKALKAEDWTGEIRGACLYTEAGFSIPDGADCEFVGCNLDNAVVPKTATVTGGTNKRIMLQNDRAAWVCDWKTGAPIEPLDKKRRLLEGENVDPAKLPAKPLTDEEIKAAEQQKADTQELAEAQEKVATLTAKLEAVK